LIGFDAAGNVCVAGETLCDVCVADKSLPGGDPGGREGGNGRRSGGLWQEAAMVIGGVEL
jgi:hypothetical protein